MAGDGELTVEQRVKMIIALAPLVTEPQIIALTVAMAHGGTRATRRIELIADDIAGVTEQRGVLRKQYESLREELDHELVSLAAMVADDEGEAQ